MAIIKPVQDIKKCRATIRLICELNDGRREGEEKGYISTKDVRTYIAEKEKKR